MGLNFGWPDLLGNVSFPDFFLSVVSLPHIPTSPSWGPLPSKILDSNSCLRFSFWRNLRKSIAIKGVDPDSIHT